MRRLEEDSEVYKMLQENRELRAAPRQSSTFRLLQEALEDEGGGEGRGEQTGSLGGFWGEPEKRAWHATLMVSCPRSRPCSPLPQPALAQRPQAGGRRPEAAHVREVRQQHRVSWGALRGGWKEAGTDRRMEQARGGDTWGDPKPPPAPFFPPGRKR